MGSHMLILKTMILYGAMRSSQILCVLGMSSQIIRKVNIVAGIVDQSIRSTGSSQILQLLHLYIDSISFE